MSVTSDNRASVKELTRRIESRIRDLNAVHLPQILKDIGQDLEDHSRQTKNYQNRTGRGVKSHFHDVIKAGQTKSIRFVGPSGTTSAQYTARKNETILVLGARMYYLFFVEVIHGFDVVIQSFLLFRRSAIREIGNRLRTIRAFTR